MDIKRIFVTGGAGYIGSVFVRDLLKRNYDVTVLDTFWFGEESLKDIADKITIIKDDVRNIKSDTIKGQDAIIDFCAVCNDPSALLLPKLTDSINHLGRARLAKLAKENGVKRYILPSSVAIYGISKVADETTATNPLTPYAVANLACENDVLPLADKDFTVTIARQCTNYGISSRMRWDLLINNFVLQLYKNRKIVIKGNGQEWRPFVHVADDSRALMAILEADSELVNKELFNIGSDQNYTIEDLAERVFTALGEEHEFLSPTLELGDWVDARNYNINCDKIKNVLGFETKYNIIDGAKEIYKGLSDGSVKEDESGFTVNWYKKLIKEGIIKVTDVTSIDTDWSEKLRKSGVLK